MKLDFARAVMLTLVTFFGMDLVAQDSIAQDLGIVAGGGQKYHEANGQVSYDFNFRYDRHRGVGVLVAPTGTRYPGQFQLSGMSAADLQALAGEWTLELPAADGGTDIHRFALPELSSRFPDVPTIVSPQDGEDVGSSFEVEVDGCNFAENLCNFSLYDTDVLNHPERNRTDNIFSVAFRPSDIPSDEFSLRAYQVVRLPIEFGSADPTNSFLLLASFSEPVGLKVVPEPSSLALTMLVAGLALFVRRSAG